MSKRLFDISASAVALALLSPVLLLAAIGIRLCSAGPIIYHARRSGLGGREFTLFKLRTMHVADGDPASRITAQHDPRVFGLGRFLRLAKIDELPQLFNIFKGDMSFVGPRPEREHFVFQLEKKIPYYRLRTTVRPGLTGWAQAHQTYVRSQEDQEIKFRYELFYLENYSLWLDLYTLVKTLRVVVARRGG